jgi:hypothetical protein
MSAASFLIPPYGLVLQGFPRGVSEGIRTPDIQNHNLEAMQRNVVAAEVVTSTPEDGCTTGCTNEPETDQGDPVAIITAALMRVTTCGPRLPPDAVPDAVTREAEGGIPDADLAALVAAWPMLAEPLKAAIRAIVGTVAGGQRGGAE